MSVAKFIVTQTDCDNRLALRPVWRLLLLFCGLSVLAQAVFATHLVDHRFSVYGEVKFPDGSPARGVLVVLEIKDGETLQETMADAVGRYQIVLHVHNQDMGKVFFVRVGDDKRKVRVLFDPNNAKAERGKREDFTVPKIAP